MVISSDTESMMLTTVSSFTAILSFSTPSPVCALHSNQSVRQSINLINQQLQCHLLVLYTSMKIKCVNESNESIPLSSQASNLPHSQLTSDTTHPSIQFATHPSTTHLSNQPVYHPPIKPISLPPTHQTSQQGFR